MPANAITSIASPVSILAPGRFIRTGRKVLNSAVFAMKFGFPGIGGVDNRAFVISSFLNNTLGSFVDLGRILAAGGLSYTPTQNLGLDPAIAVFARPPETPPTDYNVPLAINPRPLTGISMRIRTHAFPVIVQGQAGNVSTAMLTTTGFSVFHLQNIRNDYGLSPNPQVGAALSQIPYLPTANFAGTVATGSWAMTPVATIANRLYITDGLYDGLLGPLALVWGGSYNRTQLTDLGWRFVVIVHVAVAYDEWISPKEATEGFFCQPAFFSGYLPSSLPAGWTPFTTQLISGMVTSPFSTIEFDENVPAITYPTADFSQLEAFFNQNTGSWINWLNQ